MSLSDSKRRQNEQMQPDSSMSYSKADQPLYCQSCSIRFDSIRELLNHQKRFCQNSGYDNLTGLLMKQTNRNDARVDYKLNQQKNSTNKKYNQTKMKNYGQYSLSKIKYQYPNDQTANKNSLQLYEDVMGLEKHKNNLQTFRHYGLKSKFSECSQNKQFQNKNSKFLSQKKQTRSFQNSKSVSAFSYKLNQNKFQQLGSNNNAQYLQNLLLKNQPSISPPSNEALKKRSQAKQIFFEQNQQSKVIHYKNNPASQQFKIYQNQQKFSILNKSNASIANMPNQKKIIYSKHKLDQLKQIRQLYLKNGGQSKQFKGNIEKMIVFYENLLQDCKNGEKQQISTQLSIASRPETPILKLNDLNLQKKSTYRKSDDSPNKIEKSGRLNNRQLNPKLNQGINSYQNNILAPDPSKIAYPAFNSLDPNIHIAQNYANLYQMKLMQDVLKVKSEENRKLIEALIDTKKNQNHNKKQISQLNNQSSQKDQQNYRFSKEVDTNTSSEDRILKLLQQQQLDELKLISKLPVNLQDEKLQSLAKNSQLRFKMQKQILKQKLERLSWQQRLQSFEQERQVKNNDWVGTKNKDVIQTQMNSYINGFQQQFRPQYQ